MPTQSTNQDQRDDFDRPTEDDIARKKLGGPKGSWRLPPSTLTRREREQMPTYVDPGHVAYAP